MRTIALALAAVLLAGCSPISADIVKAMAASDRSWCVWWGGGMGVGPVRMGGSGVDGGSAKCNGETFEVNTTATGLPGGVVVGPGGTLMLPAQPRILQQEAPTFREVEPPPPARRAPAIRPQSFPDLFDRAPPPTLWRVLETSAEMQR